MKRVILLAGQSNCAGYGERAGLSAAMAASAARVQIWVDGEASAAVKSAWRPVDTLCGGTVGSETHYGVETSLGAYLQSIKPRDEWRIIKHGVSSTSIAADWNSGGATYAAWLAVVQTALAALGDTYSIDGMVWVQGESDAANEANSLAYQARLTTLIADIRAELAAPSMAWVLSRILASWAGFPLNVRAAQAAVAAAVTRTAMVDADDCSQAGGHYDTRGIWILGLRLGAALAGLL